MSVYDSNAFEERVNYAASCIARSSGVPQGRHFDTCFEMNDGDYVGEALYRRTLKNPNSKLAGRILTTLNANLLISVHERLKHLTRQQLVAEAAAHRNSRRQS